MKERRKRNNRILSIAFAASILFGGILTGAEKSTGVKTLPIGDYEYTFAAPSQWEFELLGDEGSMKVHLRVSPIHRVIGHFTVHVMDRGVSSLGAWLEYHKKDNLPSAHGKCRIDSEEPVSLGPLQGQLMHVLDLEGRRGYGLFDAVILTEDHVLILSYLYDLTREKAARGEMTQILSTLTASSEKLAEAHLWYELGRPLSLERFGLFLRLPTGWNPEDGKKRDEFIVRLPSQGTLRVITATRVSQKIEGLKKLIKRHLPSIPTEKDPEPCTFGPFKAYYFKNLGSSDSTWWECFMGFHGKGGYAFILETEDSDERELFRKVYHKALLMDPRKVDPWRRTAQARFEKAISEQDFVAAREALSVLELFPDNKNAIRTIEKGFFASDELQGDCADVLGRMGSKEASRVLEKAVKNKRLKGVVKKACIKALGRTKSPQGKKVLERFDKKDLSTFSPDVRQALKETLDSLSI